jgi:oxygen-independent coproporphyrinogen-3 oxidase
VAVRHLYVHLPFCAQRCGYCTFVVEVGALDRRDAYTDAVIAELDQSAGRLGPLETVYFGGGTPSLLGADRIARLIDAVRPRCAPCAEITIEANPETVDVEALRALVAAGVTRISLGAQSFRSHLLSALDRAAGPDQVRAAVSAARAAGFASVSIDLLFGVPGQTWSDLDADLAAVAELAPDHISWYELEVKPGSSLARAGAAVDQEFTEDAYRVIVDRLEGLDYQWYETANFARPGHECRHSLAYWNAADYLGVGIGAVSTVAARRWRNAPDLTGYIATLAGGGTPRRTHEDLDGDTRRRERWMLGLRLARPLPLAWAGAPDRPESLDQLVELGLVTVTDTTLTLSREGRFVQNAVLGELMEYAG